MSACEICGKTERVIVIRKEKSKGEIRICEDCLYVVILYKKLECRFDGSDIMTDKERLLIGLIRAISNFWDNGTDGLVVSAVRVSSLYD